MPKISPSKARKVIKFLKLKGFTETRQKGSHKFFSHKDGRTTVVPFHPAGEIRPGLIRKILNDVQITPQEFIDFKK